VFLGDKKKTPRSFARREENEKETRAELALGGVRADTRQSVRFFLFPATTPLVRPRGRKRALVMYHHFTFTSNIGSE
jgi:hypothetical protein